jgi:DNA repair photolyase
MRSGGADGIMDEADRGRMPHARGAAGLAVPAEARRGRGATANPDGRFEPHARETFDDGWEVEPAARRRTEVTRERARTIITRNTSPDISFDRSINPYRGCEHGCIYCFARPNHAYVGLSPGLDFETRLFAKPDAARLLERELSAPGYRPRSIALGTATDPYQPIEREHGITRAVLGVLARFRHPVGIVTKSNLVLRDRDILAAMAADGLAKVAISVTTLDPVLARRMEPRAPHPAKGVVDFR